MKRITTLLLALALVVSSVAVSHADGIDIKVKGQWDFAFGWLDNDGFTDNVARKGRRDDDNFLARQRVRTQINFITSEYLQGVLMFEIGNVNWGRKDQGGALDADGINVETKRAYLDWMIPDTEVSVRMGIQGFKLPSTPMGSPLFDADVAGVVVSSPITDWVSITGFWLRPFDWKSNDGDGNHYDDEVDIFGLVVPFSGDGWAFTPWGMYGFIGANSGFYDYLLRGDYDNTVSENNSSTKAWWVGAHLEVDILDPLVFNIEGIYGRLNRAEVGGLYIGNDGRGTDWFAAPGSEISARGWFIGATLDYKLDWGTPGIFAWYGSGDDEDDAREGKLGRMPVLGNDGGSFYPTTFGFAGSYGIGTDTNVLGTGSGHWGVGIQIADMSFIEDLSHTIRVAYYRGTNDDDIIRNGGNYNRGFFRYGAADEMYLTTKDSVIEVNFDHQYKIYENLTMVVELGWLHLNADEDVWGNRHKDEKSNAWKAQLLFQYKF